MNENIDSLHGNWRPSDLLLNSVIADLEKLVKMDERELKNLKQRKLLRTHQLIVEIMGKVPE